MEDLEKYKEMGQNFIDRLKLTTYPVAVRFIMPGEEIPKNVLRPQHVFGHEVAACVIYSWAKRAGMSFYVSGSDIACKPSSVLYFALETTDNPDDTYTAWAKKAGYKKDFDAEKKSRENDCMLSYGEIQGFVVTPLNNTVVKPDLVMIYCTPLVLSHLILAATFEGEHLDSQFNGMEASCKEGIIRTYKTNKCQVVSPGMGDRVLGAVQDCEMIFSIPESKFELVSNNLFKAGYRLGSGQEEPPFHIPHPLGNHGPFGVFGGEPAEAPVWPFLRRKIRLSKEKKQ
jgi:uncharacterized protein (DUF169 family)